MAVQMTKSQLIEKIAGETEVAKKQVKGVLETLANVGYKELKKTGVFLVPGFAKFVVIKKAATKARTEELARELAETELATLLARIGNTLRETDELIDRIVRVYREVNPSVVLTHTLADPYNGDHPAAGQMALRARVLAQAIGYPAPGEPIGAPPVFLFEPHQPEMCGFKPEVLLDITPVFDAKRKAMEFMGAQQHLWEYYTDLARRRGTQLRRNAGPNLGLPSNTMGEAYMRVFPHVTDRLS